MPLDDASALSVVVYVRASPIEAGALGLLFCVENINQAGVLDESAALRHSAASSESNRLKRLLLLRNGVPSNVVALVCLRLHTINLSRRMSWSRAPRVDDSITSRACTASRKAQSHALRRCATKNPSRGVYFIDTALHAGMRALLVNVPFAGG